MKYQIIEYYPETKDNPHHDITLTKEEAIEYMGKDEFHYHFDDGGHIAESCPSINGRDDLIIEYRVVSSFSNSFEIK